MSDNQPRKRASIADERRKLSPREAREVAAEASGFLASEIITAGGEDFEVPQRGLLDDDARERLNELEFEAQQWDRDDDVVIPDTRITHPDGSVEIVPGFTRKGDLKLPYQKDGKLVRPPYPVQLAIALWGEDKYNRYKAAGGQATDVTATLARLDKVVEARAEGDGEGEGDAKPDPKSVGGNS